MKKLLLFISILMISCTMQKKITAISSFEELNYPYPVKYVELQEDLTLAYMDEGKGKPIIMIHGLGSYAPAWKKNIEFLKQNHRCIAIDLPSYGKSSKGNYEGSMTAYSEVIKKFLEKLGLQEATLMGHSMGGQIAMVFSLAYPQHIDKLILISPAGFETFTEGQHSWFTDVVKARSIQLTPVETLISNVGYNFYSFPDDAQFMIDDRVAMRSAKGFDAYCHQIEKSVKGMLDEPVVEYLPQLEANTLIIYGQQDNLIPNRFLNPGSTETIAKQGAERIKNSRLEMIDKAGHFVHFERSAVVNPILHSFLTE